MLTVILFVFRIWWDVIADMQPEGLDKKRRFTKILMYRDLQPSFFNPVTGNQRP